MSLLARAHVLLLWIVDTAEDNPGLTAWLVVALFFALILLGSLVAPS